MALISCPDCGEDVSSKAQECRYCGRPIGVLARSVFRYIKIVLAVIVLLVFGLLCTYYIATLRGFKI